MAAVGASIVKVLRMKEFIEKILIIHVLRPLPVALLNQSAFTSFRHFVGSSLNRAVIDDECDDISKTDRSNEDTVKDIEEFVKVCLHIVIMIF